MALEELISGISVKEFYSSYWDRKPVVLSGPPGGLNRYYSTKAFESRLTESDLRSAHLKVAQNGGMVDASSYTCSRRIGGHLCEDMVDIPSIYRLWNQGATLVLHGLAASSPTLIPLLRTLELELGHPVQANAYLTPKDSRGFGIHFDAHDVFIAQIDGRKHWRVWADPVKPKPLPDDRFEKIEGFIPPGQLLFDGIVEEGMVIYIPRGYYHEAHSNDVASLHVTIGVLVYRKIDALKFLLRSFLRGLESSDLTDWRDALAPGYAEQGDSAFDSLQGIVISEILKAWGLSATIQEFREQIRPVNQHLLDRSYELEQMQLDTKLAPQSFGWPLIERDSDGLAVTYAGRILRLPGNVEKALQVAVGRPLFTPRDLTEEYTAESSLMICKHFMREGLISVANTSDEI